MSPYQHWTLEHDDHEIAWLSLNVAGSGINFLSHHVIIELEQQLADVRTTPPRGLVIQSAKKSGFIAGADINEFTLINNEQQALALIQRGQEVMNYIEELPFPTLALIKGFCMGGGLELALACNYRILIDTPSTRLSFPEIKLGIHPGFGGSVRSLRLLGTLKAMDLMLTGKTVSAWQAKKIGLVNATVPERQAGNAVKDFIDKRPANPPRPKLDHVLSHRWLRPLVARALQHQVRQKTNPHHYPAPFALIDFWKNHADAGTRMFHEEAASVAKLINTETSKNLVRVFQLRNLLTANGERKLINPQHVHVIGAGTMGGDIAAWCALQGITVTIEDANIEALAKTRQRAEKFFAKRLRGYAGELEATKNRLIPDVKGLGRAQADVVIEAIYENLEAKQALFKDLEQQTKANALLTTNTSSIPIEQIAKALNDPGRLVGLHFFNPVAKMPLIEVIHTENTAANLLAKTSAFCLHINKLPLPVKSSPGFLVNRILMPYLLEAAIMRDEGVDTLTIDKAAKDFGMPMGPLELADTVGLDVCLHVAETLSETMELRIPSSLKNAVQSGNLGKKTGKGFYQWQKNKKEAPMSSSGTSVSLYNNQKRLIATLTKEAEACLTEKLVLNADSVDAGIIFGTGFAPWTGGPLKHLKSQ